MLRHIARARPTCLRLLNGLAVFLVLLALVFGTGGRSYSQSAGFTPETLLVAHQLTDGSTAISQLSLGGVLMNRFGTLPGTLDCCSFPTEFRAHLALSGGFLFRSNGTYPPPFFPVVDTISEFNPDGTLKATITPTTSLQHDIVPMAQDFANSSIYMVDAFGGTNLIWHLDNPSTGASSVFAGVFYTGVGEIVDLYFGGPIGSEALYALTQTSPSITPCVVPGCTYRVAKIGPTGTVQFFDNPELVVPFVFDIGSLAVAPIGGNIYVATSTKIVKMDASGAPLGSFPLVDPKPSLDVDVDGMIYVGHFGPTVGSATGQIDVFLPSGELVRTINVPGATRIYDILIVRPPM
jgi:hypothetical protein